MRKSKGFTLIELLVVIAIIGILAVVILSALSQARKSAADAKRKEAVTNVMTAIEAYAATEGSFPVADTPAKLQTAMGKAYLASMPTQIEVVDVTADSYYIRSDEFTAKTDNYFCAKDGVTAQTTSTTNCP